MQYRCSKISALAMSLGLSLSVATSSVSAQQAPDYDPWQPVNVKVHAFNDYVDSKLQAAANDTGRLMLNTTFGLGGVLDLATWAGFDKNEEDFGQTLGYWGVPPGPYVVIPLFGPSTVRDGLGFGVDNYTNPLNHREDDLMRNAAFVLQQVDRRVEAMAVDSLMSGDPYIFTREAYLQQREYLVKDGEVASQQSDWGNWD